jgi:hypothetical protein
MRMVIDRTDSFDCLQQPIISANQADNVLLESLLQLNNTSRASWSLTLNHKNHKKTVSRANYQAPIPCSSLSALMTDATTRKHVPAFRPIPSSTSPPHARVCHHRPASDSGKMERRRPDLAHAKVPGASTLPFPTNCVGSTADGGRSWPTDTTPASTMDGDGDLFRPRAGQTAVWILLCRRRVGNWAAGNH